MTATVNKGWQAFTTGTHSAGYTVSAIEIEIRATASSPVPVIRLYADSSGSPDTGSVVANFNNPSTVRSNTVNEFTANGTVTLSASTTYWVFMGVSSGSYKVKRTESASEDSGGAPGWSIADDRVFSFGADLGGSLTTDTSDVFKIAIEGEEREGSN